MGGAFGAALMWSVLIIALNYSLDGAGGTGLRENAFAILQGGPQAFAHLAADLRAQLLPALNRAFHGVFATGCILASASLATAALLRERPLRTTAAPPPLAD